MEKPFSSEMARDADSALDFKDIINILAKNRLLILAIIIVTTVLVVIFMPKKEIVYEAVTTMMLKQKDSPQVSLQSLAGQNNVMPFLQSQTSVKTYIELIKSLTVAEAAAKILISENIKNADAASLNYSFSNSVGDMAYYIQEHIDVDYVEKANYLRIRSRADTEGFAVKITNLVTNVFLNFNKNLGRSELKSALDYIAEQKSIVKNKLKLSEDELETFIKATDAKFLNEGVKTIIERLVQLDARSSELEINEAILKRNISELKKTLSNSRDEITGLTLSQSATTKARRLKTKYNELVEKYRQMKSYMKETHPDLQRTKIELDQIYSEMQQELANAPNEQGIGSIFDITPPYTIGETLKNTIVDAERKIKMNEKERQELTSQKEYWSQELKSQPIASLRHMRLLKEVEANNMILMRLIQREEELFIMEARELGDLTLVDKARQAYLITPPQSKTIAIGLGFVLGVIIGVSAALIKEYLNPTFKGSNDVAKVLKQKVISIVPEIGTDDISDVPESAVHQISPMVITFTSPKAPAAEAFRALRIVLELSIESIFESRYKTEPEKKKIGKTILLVSPAPGEGKSLCAANVAFSFANIGKKVIIVDTDTRKPSLNRLFNVNSSPGLIELVFKDFDIDSVIIKDLYPNLDVITAGERLSNEIEFTSSRRFLDLLEILKTRYEYVIFDSPAMLVVSDPIMLAPKMDAVVMLIKHNETKYESAIKALRFLENVKAPLCGIVYNGVKSERKYYYKYYEN